MSIRLQGRVPRLEDAFELNLPVLLRSARTLGHSLVLDDGDGRLVVMLIQDGLAVLAAGLTWWVDIVQVEVLKGRHRPLLRCPRAHEGNFQSLYYLNGMLACRHCHRLRYSTTLASSATARARIARLKLLSVMGGQPGDTVPSRKPGTWRTRYRRLVDKLNGLSGVHYSALREWLSRDRD